MADITMTLTVRHKWWVAPFMRAAVILARAGVPMRIERVAKFLAAHGVICGLAPRHASSDGVIHGG